MSELDIDNEPNLDLSLIDGLRNFGPKIDLMEIGFVLSYEIQEPNQVRQGVYPRIAIELTTNQMVYMYIEERVKGQMMLKIYSEVPGYKSSTSTKIQSVTSFADEFLNLSEAFVERRVSQTYDIKNNKTTILHEIQRKDNLF